VDGGKGERERETRERGTERGEREGEGKRGGGEAVLDEPLATVGKMMRFHQDTEAGEHGESDLSNGTGIRVPRLFQQVAAGLWRNHTQPRWKALVDMEHLFCVLARSQCVVLGRAVGKDLDPRSV